MRGWIASKRFSFETSAVIPEEYKEWIVDTCGKYGFGQFDGKRTGDRGEIAQDVYSAVRSSAFFRIRRNGNRRLNDQSALFVNPW